jgi:hypothetical protein
VGQILQVDYYNYLNALNKSNAGFIITKRNLVDQEPQIEVAGFALRLLEACHAPPELALELLQRFLPLLRRLCQLRDELLMGVLKRPPRPPL